MRRRRLVAAVVFMLEPGAPPSRALFAPCPPNASVVPSIVVEMLANWTSADTRGTVRRVLGGALRERQAKRIPRG